MISPFYSHFNPSEIDIEYDKEADMYYGIFKNASDKNKCFKISLNKTNMVINGIKFENEVNCALPGSTILNKLIDIAKELDLEYIQLYDVSRIYRPGMTSVFNISIDSYPLYILYILLHGQSWYNSKGFYSDFYSEEIEFNQINRNMSFNSISFDNHSPLLVESKVKNIGKLREKFAIDKENLRKELLEAGLEINENTTLYDIALFLRSTDDIFDTTVHFIDFIANYKLIYYHPFLVLRLKKEILHKSSSKKTSVSKKRKSYKSKPKNSKSSKSKRMR